MLSSGAADAPACTLLAPGQHALGAAEPLDGHPTGGPPQVNARLANLSRMAVLVLTIVWATNFPVIKAIYASGLTPPDYALIRFFLSAAALLPLARWDNWALILGAARCGAWVAAGYISQAIALSTASANKGAFICACQVIVVALLNAVRKRTCVARTWAASSLAICGVGLLELAGPVEPELADLWCLGMPLGFGLGYAALEALMEEYPNDARTVSAVKVAVVGLSALGWAVLRALLLGRGAQMFDGLTSPHLPWAALLYTGLVTTAGAILVESYAFKYVPATDAAVILATEPLWAALFAAHFLGEQLTGSDVAGGALVLAACIVNEVRSICPDRGKAAGRAHVEHVPLLLLPAECEAGAVAVSTAADLSPCRPRCTSAEHAHYCAFDDAGPPRARAHALSVPSNA
ncbi:hypothetical protein KFE25_002166 [Diacronema lutheri]|uniref:EamA domain-containing protein n=2 Tax=Diacronema lutheri TaxID=2081491 RepID=A0A8J5XR71_DIALT|nr:hypothetical protein KFE25_002166 [Diacronema lutheri]